MKLYLKPVTWNLNSNLVSHKLIIKLKEIKSKKNLKSKNWKNLLIIKKIKPIKKYEYLKPQVSINIKI